jgi:hypothetical protein
MAVRPCYYLVLDNNTFLRLRKDTFYRIMLQHEDEAHPEFKGQRVRYAAIYIQYEGRRPLTVKRASFGYISFDENGRFDDAEWQKEQELFVQYFPDPENRDKPGVEEARIAHLDAQIERELGWEPSPTLRHQLYDAALHNKLSGGYLS